MYKKLQIKDKIQLICNLFLNLNGLLDIKEHILKILVLLLLI